MARYPRRSRGRDNRNHAVGGRKGVELKKIINCNHSMQLGDLGHHGDDRATLNLIGIQYNQNKCCAGVVVFVSSYGENCFPETYNIIMNR